LDTAGNGHLSLKEIHKGLVDFVGESNAIVIPAIKLAFAVMKKMEPSQRESMKLEDCFAELSEFNSLLLYMTQYFQLYANFQAVDTNHDDKISFEEFEEAIEFLYEEWGLVVSDEKAEYELMDVNGRGAVSFDEFCFWALKKNDNRRTSMT